MSEGLIDWRLADQRDFRSHDLPVDQQEACRDLIQRLGLWFGAIDLAVNGDGYWFLELNQNGEWGWLQATVGLPIVDAIVEELLSASAPVQQ